MSENTDKERYLISNSKNFIKDRRVSIRLWFDDEMLHENLFHSESRGMSFDNPHIKFKFIPQSISFENLQKTFPHFEKKAAAKNIEYNNFFQYFLKALMEKSEEIKIPSEIKEVIGEYIKSSEFLKKEPSANLRGERQHNFLIPSNNFISFNSPYASIEPQKYLRSYFEETKALSQNLEAFIRAHNTCVEYIDKNISSISSALGQVIVSSNLEEVSDLNFYSLNYNERTYQNVKIYDVEFGKISSGGRLYLKFKHDKEEVKYFQTKNELCLKIENALRKGMGYDKTKKSTNNYLFIDKTNLEQFENLKTPGLEPLDRELVLGKDPVLGNQGNNKSAFIVLSQRSFDLKKFIPPRIKKNVTLNFLLHDFPSYSLEAINRDEKYGSRDLFYIYASVKPGSTNLYKTSGFFKNKTGSHFTLELSEAFGFSNLALAQESIDKSEYSKNYDFSFIKAKFELVDITGAKPGHDKEFMNYLTQWEKESLTKLIDSTSKPSFAVGTKAQEGQGEEGKGNIKRNKI